MTAVGLARKRNLVFSATGHRPLPPSRPLPAAESRDNTRVRRGYHPPTPAATLGRAGVFAQIGSRNLLGGRDDARAGSAPSNSGKIRYYNQPPTREQSPKMGRIKPILLKDGTVFRRSGQLTAMDVATDRAMVPCALWG